MVIKHSTPIILWHDDQVYNGVSIHSAVTTAETLPPLHLTRAVCAFAFDSNQRLLLTKHPDPCRGWDIPGGHIEQGETFHQTLIREFIEETGVVIQPLHIIAQLTFEVQSPKPANYNYPYPISFTPVFLARVKQIQDFAPRSDAIDRGFFDPNSVLHIGPPTAWLAQQEALMAHALDRLTSITSRSQHTSDKAPTSGSF